MADPLPPSRRRADTFAGLHTTRPACNAQEQQQLDFMANFQVAGFSNPVLAIEERNASMATLIPISSVPTYLAAQGGVFFFIICAGVPDPNHDVSNWVWASGSLWCVFAAILPPVAQGISFPCDLFHCTGTIDPASELFGAATGGRTFNAPAFFLVPSPTFYNQLHPIFQQFVISRTSLVHPPPQGNNFLGPNPAAGIPGGAALISSVPKQLSGYIAFCFDGNPQSCSSKSGADRILEIAALIRCTSKARLELLVKQLVLDTESFRSQIIHYSQMVHQNTLLSTHEMFSASQWTRICRLPVCSDSVPGLASLKILLAGHLDPCDWSVISWASFHHALNFIPWSRECTAAGRRQLAECLENFQLVVRCFHDEKFVHFLQPLIDELRSNSDLFQNFADVLIAVNLWNLIATVYHSLATEKGLSSVFPNMDMSTVDNVIILFESVITSCLTDMRNNRGPWTLYPHSRFYGESGFWVTMKHKVSNSRSSSPSHSVSSRTSRSSAGSTASASSAKQPVTKKSKVTFASASSSSSSSSSSTALLSSAIKAKKLPCPWFIASELRLQDTSVTPAKLFSCNKNSKNCHHVRLLRLTREEAIAAVNGCQAVNEDRSELMIKGIQRAGKTVFRK